MDEQHLDLLYRARGLASATALIQRAREELIAEALASSVDLSALSRALGVHRSTIYRHSPRPEQCNDDSRQ